LFMKNIVLFDYSLRTEVEMFFARLISF
jgi:hypothetical protein